MFPKRTKRLKDLVMKAFVNTFIKPTPNHAIIKSDQKLILKLNQVDSGL